MSCAAQSQMQCCDSAVPNRIIRILCCTHANPRLPLAYSPPCRCSTPPARSCASPRRELLLLVLFVPLPPVWRRYAPLAAGKTRAIEFGPPHCRRQWLCCPFSRLPPGIAVVRAMIWMRLRMSYVLRWWKWTRRQCTAVHFRVYSLCEPVSSCFSRALAPVEPAHRACLYCSECFLLESRRCFAN